MARAAWRDALDAKIRVMGILESTKLQQAAKFVGAENLYDAIIRSLYVAEPIWIEKGVSTGILNNTLPETARVKWDKTLIPPIGFIWFQSPLSMLVRDNMGEVEVVVRGIQYTFELGDLRVTAWQHTEGSLSPLVFNLVQYGQVIEDWITERAIAIDKDAKAKAFAQRNESRFQRILSSYMQIDTIETARMLYGNVLCYMATLFRLMEQHITVAPSEPVDRAARREAEKSAMPTSNVRVIRWRLKKYQKLESPGNVVDWSCHWSVKEHTRHYKDGKTIKVSSYIKGPRDKPYKPPTPNVHVVDR